MERRELIKLAEQIKKYDISNTFYTVTEFDDWLDSLTDDQIEKINSLDVDPNKIIFDTKLLINEDLLSCDDYCDRVKLMMKIKVAEGRRHLLEYLCTPSFLSHPSYYEDMKLLSKHDNPRWAICAIGEDSFNNSPYRSEDLKLILNAKDSDLEKKDDEAVAEALSYLASCEDSIESKYHRHDMEFISNVGSKYLQSTHAYPQHGINILAMNPASLNDEYHIDNMKLLASRNDNGTKSGETLIYKIMTNPYYINSERYRECIDMLINAKSYVKLAAMYLYICKKSDIENLDFYDSININEYVDSDLPHIFSCCYNEEDDVAGIDVPECMQHLNIINNSDESHTMDIGSILKNEDFMSSPYRNYDIDLLIAEKNPALLRILYRLFNNIVFISSPYHISDLKFIMNSKSDRQLQMLYSCATSTNNIYSPNHNYDMLYISTLDIDSLDKDIMTKIDYFLDRQEGINHPKHVEILEDLKYGNIPSEETLNENIKVMAKTFCPRNLIDRITKNTKN